MGKFSYEALVVGCGLSGAVAARHLAEDCGKRVLVIDRRSHIAGNMYDFKDENGILVQLYGPHIFHTKKKELFDFISKYADWEHYELTCMAKIDGKFTPSPFNFQTIDDYYPAEDAAELKRHIKAVYGKAEKTTIVEMLNSTDPVIKQYAQFLFDKDYSLYTAKQWGISPSEIDVSVLKRVPVLFSYKIGYFDDEYQVMPKESFVAFFEKLLDHKNIEIRLETDAASFINVENGTLFLNGEPATIPVIYTGAIDELLCYKYGKLPYRSLRFEYRTENTDSYQDAPVVAYPQAEGFTRITEYTKLPVQKTNGKTKIAVEYPLQYAQNNGSEPYYPILTEESQKQYAKYRREADEIENLFLCGRLADFKYYNMDQALENALQLCERLT
ncbi:MAG: UDP-galactopyranose mutase [Oscillospiraceae bacterium]|nr:UDP-galactopyranose mutase [Oscillospiraceae bacterium]